MPRILDQAWRSCGVVIALVLALAGCGPGTGGTGTGPISLTFSGAGNALTAPPSPSDFCGAPACDRVDLRLEDGRVELAAGCRRFIHLGDWQVDDAGAMVLQGTLETTDEKGTGTMAATLRLQFSERDLATANVSVLLLDAGGAAVVGPVSLYGQGATAPPPATCRSR